MTADDDLSGYVERSRTAQNLPERVTHSDAISALVELVRVAREAEAQRRAERSASEPIRTTTLSGEPEAA